MRRLRISWHGARLGLLTLAVVMLWPAGVACAEEGGSFGISSFTSHISSPQAGAHSDFTASFLLSTERLGNPIQQLKDAQFQLPAGLLGNTQAIPRCSAIDFLEYKCPTDAQVGVIEPDLITGCRGVSTTLGAGGVGQIPPTTLTEAVAWNGSTLTVGSTAGMEPGDYLTIGSGEIETRIPIWSIPDATHLILSWGLFRGAPAGTLVYDDSIGVASTAGFCGGQEGGTITVGSGATAEEATIASVESSTRLSLDAPLMKTHALGEAVTHRLQTVTGPLPLFNLEPSPGHVATLGVSLLITDLLMQLDVREHGSPGLTASMSDMSTLFGVAGATVTLWGVPAEPVHEPERCGELGDECGPLSTAPVAFMTSPTNCSEQLTTSISLDSWQEPGHIADASSTLPAMTGCERLQMSPTLSVSSDNHQLDTPAGYTVDLGLPQNEKPGGLATPALKTVSLTLPAGASLSPPAALGLEGCTEAQFSGSGCPGASSIGTASIASPLLPDRLEGHVYLAEPTPSEPYRVFVLASADGATVRLLGDVHPDPATGQLTIVFEENPQFPLSDLRMSFFGGPSALLANPSTCGPANTTSHLTSFGGQSASLESSFTISAGGEGAGCPAVQPFSPHFTAGTITPLAGSFSPFTMTISREDGEQTLSALTAQLPAGLMGMLSRVPPCGQAQAQTGSCPQASRIGSTLIGAGAGSDPLYLSGSVYLTEAYEGAPFGLSVVVPATVGPFNLGTIVLRARILVDPGDLHLTIVSDPIPQILDGVPLRLRTVSLTLDQQGFIFNPSDCSPQSVTATISGGRGATDLVSSPFRVAGCSGLSMAPRLTASTEAKASARGDGASLDVTIANSTGPGVADIKAATVVLPTQLRPRLSTIQKACLVSTYLVSPADCPPESLIGHATVHTPVLGSSLSGPVYLVFRGGTTYPDLMMSLQSQGVRVELEGSLSISAKGVISAAFRALPDAPISSLHLELPRGPHSILGATEDLCSKKLTLPYTITGQNEAVVRQATTVSIEGCSRRARAKVRSHVKQGRRAGRKHRRVS
jgi:hypothetical protein